MHECSEEVGLLLFTYNLRYYYYNFSDEKCVLLDTRPWIISKTPCNSQNCTVLNSSEEKVDTTYLSLF